ncbi:MAG: hypothetical protein LBQ08_01460 [Holosporaceae bacterium]|jgi:hypothetical protein|nr:hypothetical protein [Holosporaceae bacterium]
MLSKILTLLQLGRVTLKKAHIGAIMIEFALAIPLLITILYYMHDIPKYKRIQSKMEFAAHCAANILQNVSKNRTNKRITWNDMKYALIQGGMTFYPETSVFCIGGERTHIYGHCLSTFVHCVKGLEDGKASVLWQIMYSSQNNTTPAENFNTGVLEGHACSVVKYLQNVDPSSILEGLKINKDEIKILIEYGLLYVLSTSGYAFTDGRICLDVSPQKAFGFLILSPKVSAGDVYFTRVVVFTPKPGLFDETPTT